MKKDLIRAYLLKGNEGTEFIVAQDVEERCVKYFRVEELSFEEHGALIDTLITK